MEQVGFRRFRSGSARKAGGSMVCQRWSEGRAYRTYGASVGRAASFATAISFAIVVERMPEENLLHNVLCDLLARVKDPEIPFLSISELGILRRADFDGSIVTVVIAPTYLACPAIDTIEHDIKQCLKESGYKNVKIVRQFEPSWTTNWITKDGRDKMLKYGIAPPNRSSLVSCSRCGSSATKCLSEVGSSMCKSIFCCEECLETFEYFKCL